MACIGLAIEVLIDAPQSILLFRTLNMQAPVEVGEAEEGSRHSSDIHLHLHDTFKMIVVVVCSRLGLSMVIVCLLTPDAEGK